MIMAGHQHVKFVCYPISREDSGGKQINWIAERTLDPSYQWRREDYNRTARLEEFLPWFKDWKFDWLDVPGLIENCPHAYEYPLVDRDPVSQWTFGRVTLMGDAAHPMYPIGSNGASQAILDARVITREILAHGATNAALVAYEAERRPAILTGVDRYTDLLTRGVLLAPQPLRLGVLGMARAAFTLAPVTSRVLRRAGMLDTRYESSPLISGKGDALGGRAPDARLTRNGVAVRLHELVTQGAALLLLDDGRLPAWSVAEIARRLPRVDGLNVARVMKSGATSAAEDLVDAAGTLWREWSPRPGTAVLVRPDAHVGWMAERPTGDQLAIGVTRALGADSTHLETEERHGTARREGGDRDGLGTRDRP
jgi:hypothetical protein